MTLAQVTRLLFTTQAFGKSTDGAHYAVRHGCCRASDAAVCGFAAAVLSLAPYSPRQTEELSQFHKIYMLSDIGICRCVHDNTYAYDAFMHTTTPASHWMLVHLVSTYLLLKCSWHLVISLHIEYLCMCILYTRSSRVCDVQVQRPGKPSRASNAIDCVLSLLQFLRPEDAQQGSKRADQG